MSRPSAGSTTSVRNGQRPAANAAALVERGHELVQLADAIGSAERRGSFVLVEGPAGIGKTSLLAAAAAMAGESGRRVLPARGMELERQFSFGLVRQLFELTLVAAGGRRREELLSGAAGAAAAVLGSTGDQQAVLGDFAVLNGLFWLTANLCQDQPLVLLVDDLHWADRGSLRFLNYLLPRLEELRVVVVGAARQHEPGAEQHLLDLLTESPACMLLRPGALSQAGAAAVLSQEFGTAADRPFLAACHTATGGNPLLLRAMGRVAAADGLTPTADSIGLLPRLGVEALGTRIESRMKQLPPASAGLARAVALLGTDTPLELAAALAGLTDEQAATAVRQLEQIQLLRPQEEGLEFAHPLVRTAIYEQIPADERIAGHAAAARLLAERGADVERVATHLLRVPVTGDQQTVAVLRLAGDRALHRGSPDTALAYLRRCLEEPLDQATRLAVLGTAGMVANGVDLGVAERHLSEAMRVATDPHERARLAYGLGRVLYYLVRYDDARQVCVDALQWVPPEDIDLCRRLQAGLVSLGVAVFRHPELPARVDALRRLDPHPSVGGRMLDAVIACYDGTANDPAAVARAERALGDGLLVDQAPGDTAVVCGWWALVAADHDGVMASMDSAVARAHQTGSFYSLAASLTWRGLGWLHRGDIGEAVSDLRRSVEAAVTAQIEIARLFSGPWLADALIEQGDLDGAEEIMRWVDVPEPQPPGSWYLGLYSRAQLLRARGRHQAALAAALAAGANFAGLGGINPAFMPWRSEVALCLHAVGDGAQAVRYAEEELELARRWGAPRALGRALRVAGLVRGHRAGLELLSDAVDVLAGSPARLEHAKALIDLGAALRRAGRRADAKGRLSSGLELAEHCGAAATLIRHAEVELHATGEITHLPQPPGTGMLTPSENRVARLAASGLSNRDIAQQLFVTVKTVELHLGNTYRKLGVSGREQLVPLLSEPS